MQDRPGGGGGGNFWPMPNKSLQDYGSGGGSSATGGFYGQVLRPWLRVLWGHAKVFRPRGGCAGWQMGRGV